MQLQNLTTLKTDEDIRHHLGKIPPTLEVLYRDIYEQITTNQGSTSKTLARNTFSLLLRLKENLLPSEFVKLVQSHDGEDSQEMLPSTILDICCNLIVLDKTLNVFRFAHLSVREFLEKLPEFAPPSSHSMVATICMRHIDSAEKSAWLTRYVRQPIRTIGDYIAFWLIIHFQSAGKDERLKSPLLRNTVALLSRNDFSSLRADEKVLFLKRAECRALPVPRNIDPKLAIFFNACAVGFSELVEAFIVAYSQSEKAPSEVSISEKQLLVLSETFGTMEHGGQVFSDPIKRALAPNPLTRFGDPAKHLISHGNCPVLNLVLSGNLCNVTEALLLQAVNTYDTRKTSGPEWKEPADIVDLLLQFVRPKLWG
jgi:hypothetical protein